MKRIKEQIEISELLAGRVLGSLNQEQEARLQQWESKPENKEVLKDILNNQGFTNWNEQIESVDTSVEWSRFINTMQASQNKGRLIRMKVIKAVASVAAVLVLGFTLYLTYNLSFNTNELQTIAESSIQPGSPHAQLVLADGQVVNLEATTEDVITEGDIDIENIMGVLAYSGSERAKGAVKPLVNTLRTPRGGEYQLVLADGTKVWMNSDSELSYSVPFSGNERRVKLKGEAYFDVTRNEAMPFIVETEQQSIEVLGTEFNISAYGDDLNVVTTLVEGKVKNSFEPGNKEIILAPGEQTVLNKETHTVLTQEVDTYLYTSWKDGRLKFNNEPLDSFLTKVARWYDVEIFIEDESLKEIRFTGDLPRYKNMASILNIMEAEMSVRIKIEDNKIIHVSR